MTIHFSQHPGKRERHLQRQYQNVLFPRSRRDFNQQRIEGARYMDEQETEEFLREFQKLVAQISLLKANEDSENILQLKAQLEKSYVQCCGLSGEQSEISTAIANLLQVIMRAVWQGAEGDPQAVKHLQQEELARSRHFQLLAYPLVVDLLDPDSIIREDELAATLLSESPESLQTGLLLFDQQQLLSLFEAAMSLLEKTRLKFPHEHQEILDNAWKNLQLIKQALDSG